jgi:putative MATE family efflux protein
VSRLLERIGLPQSADDSPTQPASARAGKNRGRDLTQGPIGRTLLAFALPVMGANVLQSMSGTINAAWVSHTLGDAALTAISNANIIMFLMMGSAFGASMAANLLIGQAIGSGDHLRVRMVVGTAISFFVVLSLAIGVAGYLLTPGIVTGIGAPGEARGQAITYLRMIFIAMPVMYFFNFLQMAQRATGDSRTPFYFSLAAALLDVTLNPVLIMGLGPAPRLGIAGSALATLTAQTITLGGMLIYLYRSHSVLMLRRADWGLFRPQWVILRTLMLKGFPLALQMVVVSGSGLILISMVNSYGVRTAAAYGAAAQLWTYVQMPAMAIGAGASAMAAQCVGAGRMDRLNRIAWVSSLIAAVISAVPIGLIYMFEAQILRLILPADSPALPIALHINVIVLWAFGFFAISFAVTGVVRATGAVWPPLIGMVFAMWVIRLPFAAALQPTLGADAIWWSFPLGTITSMLISVSYYRWGNWRSGRMLDDLPRGETADTGLAPPSGVEETEIAAEVIRSRSSGPNTPVS